MNSKKITNNNPLLSIGSDSEYSATSIDQTGGGIMNWLLGSNSGGDYATDLAMDAFQNKYPQIAYFVIRHALDKSVQLDFSKVGVGKRNLLHHLVEYSIIPVVCDLLFIVLDNTNAKKYINSQDEEGNTLAHIAAKNKLDLVIDKLIALKADLSIANNANKVVQINSSSDTKQTVPDIFMKATKKCDQSVDEVDYQLDQLLGPLLVKTDSDNLSNFRRTEAMQDSIIQPSQPNNIFPPRKNNIFSEQSMSISSDDILNQILNDNSRQFGGKSKNLMTGRRSMTTYSEDPQILTGGDSEDDEEDYDFSEASSIARTVENQATEAHKRSVERIKEILGVDEIEARAYKAILYDTIKKEGDRSNYDRAIELEKRASNKDILNNISKKDVKNMVKLIDDKHKMKESSDSNRSSEKSSEPAKPKKGKKAKDEILTSESGLDTISSIDIE